MNMQGNSGHTGDADEFGEDELTVIMRAPSELPEQRVPAPPPSFPPPPATPHNSVFVDDGDFLDHMALDDDEFSAPAPMPVPVPVAAPVAAPAPVPHRGNDRSIAVIAGTTTIAALALVGLVAMKVMSNDKAQVVVMQAPAGGVATNHAVQPARSQPVPSRPDPGVGAPSLAPGSAAVAPANAPAVQAPPQPAALPPAKPAEENEPAVVDGADDVVDLSALPEGRVPEQPAAQAPRRAPPKPAAPKPATRPVGARPKQAATPPAAPARAAAPAPRKPVERAAAKARSSKPRAASAAPATEAPGHVTIVCQPACDSVTLDGRNLGPSPVVLVKASAGTHSVRLSAKGYPTKTLSLRVKGGETTARRVKLVK